MTLPVDCDGLRQRKKRAARSALRLAALELVAERGYSSVTVDDIATRADMSPRTFFNYFSSKEESLFALDPELMEASERAIAGADPARSAWSVLCEVVLALVDEAAHDTRVIELRRVVVERQPELAASFLGASVESERRWVEALRTREVSDGAPDDGYAELLVASCWSAARVAFRTWRRQESPALSIGDLLRVQLTRLGDGFGR
jgi:AcrR family transcriptional regulator